MYDRNVKHVCTAAATPQALYAGERLAGAFERTTSRLIEMRSEEYLARGHRDGGRTTGRSSWLEACGFWCNRPLQLEADAAAVRVGLHQAHPHRFAERQFGVGFDARHDRRLAQHHFAATPVLAVDLDHRTLEHLAYARGQRGRLGPVRSEEHTSELQSLMRTSYAVFCLNKTTYRT